MVKVSKTVATLIAGLLAVATYAQSELHVSHTVHVVIGCVFVLAGTLGVTHSGFGNSASSPLLEPAKKNTPVS